MKRLVGYHLKILRTINPAQLNNFSTPRGTKYRTLLSSRIIRRILELLFSLAGISIIIGSVGGRLH